MTTLADPASSTSAMKGNGLSEDRKPRLDVQSLIDEAIAENDGDPLAQLSALTQLVHDAEQIQRQSAPYRARLVLELKRDDRSVRWIARKIGVTQQSLSQMVYRQAKKDGVVD